MVESSEVCFHGSVSPDNQSLVCPLTPNMVHLRFVTRCEYSVLAPSKSSIRRANGRVAFLLRHDYLDKLQGWVKGLSEVC